MHYLKNKKRKRGFTLMEILVVISIVAILGTISYPAIRTARDKADDSKIKASIAAMRPDIELYYDEQNGSYDDVCDHVSENTDSISDVSDSVLCIDSPTEWAVEAQLVFDEVFYCLDRLGAVYYNELTSITDGADYRCGE